MTYLAPSFQVCGNFLHTTTWLVVVEEAKEQKAYDSFIARGPAVRVSSTDRNHSGDIFLVMAGLWVFFGGYYM